MSLKELFSLKGRISSVTFSDYQFIIFAPIFMLRRLSYFFGSRSTSLSLFFIILTIPFYILLICKTIERLHDLNLPTKIIIFPIAFTLPSQILRYSNQLISFRKILFSSDLFISFLKFYYPLSQYTSIFVGIFYLFLLFKPGHSVSQPNSVSASTIFITLFIVNKAAFFIMYHLR